MTNVTTKGSARAWGGVKRPPVGMSGVLEMIWEIISAANGRCPAVPSEVCYE